MTPEWFQELFSRLHFTEQRLLPSWWLSTGLLEASRPSALVPLGDPPWAQSLMFLALLVSNAMFFNLVGTWLAGKVYRVSYSRLYDEPSSHRRASTWWLDSVLGRWAFFLPRDIRVLLVKDFRLFRRDPVQWSQFIISFGLLALYVVNIRRLSYIPNYSAMIGFLNLAVVGLILSTFTTRFIFPMISLEGRRLWILGLLPIHRDAILWSKFLFAAFGSLVPCMTLVLLSDLMLQINLVLVIVFHQISCVVLCVGLSAIAVGLGAKMPDLRAHSPSKIAAGFGGTLNLVISAGYIVLVVLLTALPIHLFLGSGQEAPQTFIDHCIHFLGSAPGIGTGIALTLLTGIIATVWPMQVGFRAFRKLEL
jgi:ABC-2 type transport system permease protein